MERDLEETRGVKLSPYAISRWRGNAVGAAVALRHGLGGCVLSLNAASATGAQIIWMAGSMIRGGVADLVVAVAADPCPSELVGKALGRNGSVAKDAASTPLSPGRSGMIPAEGAACLILESAYHLAKRGAVPLAEWLGGGCLNESHHLQAPDPDGAALEGLTRDVLAEYLPASPTDWISLHATGTPRYDSVEARVIQRLFGERMPWVSAFKGITGHALSASGLLEAALLVEGLRRGEVPPLPQGIDESLGLSLPDGKKPPVPKTALQIAQGMGGDVVVNLLGADAVQP
jgi:3-oxoacyl-[acyl-carrier-protein] synthase II